jgi:hypothetical protein
MQDSIKSIHWSCTGDEVLALQLKGVAKQLLFKHLAEMQKSTVLSMSRLYSGAEGSTIFISVDCGMVNITLDASTVSGGTTQSVKFLTGFGCVPGVGRPYSLVGTKDARLVWKKVNTWRSSRWSVEKIITGLNGVIVSRGHNVLLFGNVDWKGPKQDESKDPGQRQRKVLTWKGPPSRYWPLDQFVNIPGTTVVDHLIESIYLDTYYYTPFSGKVYEHGVVRATMPDWYWPNGENNKYNAQVLGAAYRESDGKLFCVVKTCYLQHPVPEERKYGYYFELITQGPSGWERLLQIETPGMPNTNWFFSEDGTKACTVLFLELHKIVLTQDSDKVTTCSYSTEALGGFHNAIAKTRTLDNSEAHSGTPGAGGIFAGIGRTGVKAGDWIGMNESTDVYSSEKSGTLTLAADYKGNDLVKMQAKLTGNEIYSYYRKFGMKWGGTALPPNGHSADADRMPSIRIDVDPFNYSTDSWNGINNWTGVVGVNIGGVCKPDITINGVSTGASRSGTIAKPCLHAGDTFTVTASVTDLAGGRTATVTKTYLLAQDFGVWVQDLSFTSLGGVDGNCGYAEGPVMGNTKYSVIRCTGDWLFIDPCIKYQSYSELTGIPCVAYQVGSQFRWCEYVSGVRYKWDYVC